MPPVAVDAAAVTEVLYILLDNASKYASPRTTISVEAEREDARTVRATVTDEGPGIAPEFRERVFENFFRIPGRESSDPRRVGVGLGLPIARRLIEAQAGRMWIGTPPSGRGTMFAFTRRVTEHMMAISAVETSRVLVVDDEPQITRVLRTVLTSQGYQVQTAGEGESALASFTDWHPELVITDLFMPRMDGLELCRRIRAVSNVPIIVLSVKGEERTKVEALDLGVDDYVTKPFGIDELLARVRAALRRATGAASDVPSFDVGDFKVDLEGRRIHARGSRSAADAEGVRSLRVLRAAPEQGHHAPDAARGRVGRGIAGAARVPARVHGPAAQEARARSVESAGTSSPSRGSATG